MSKSAIKKDKTKILFVGNRKSSFVKNDYNRLQKKFNVIPISMSSASLPIFLFKTFFLVKWSDVVFCWFASWESFLPVLFGRLLKKKSIVVAGGYDCANEPKINYGAFTNLKEKIPASFVLKNANVVLAVSNFTKEKVLEKVKTRQATKVVYNGVDIGNFKPSQEKKEKMIVTIGQVTRQKIKLKGLDTFAKSSIKFPDHKFVIIGHAEEQAVNELKKINPHLIFTGQIPHIEVVKWLQQSEVYCQLSYVESFGLGLAEAMSCSCIPIVTDKGALSEVIGNTGYCIPYGDAKATVEAIKKALNAPDGFGNKARKKIKDNFSLQRRENNLIKTIKG